MLSAFRGMRLPHNRCRPALRTPAWFRWTAGQALAELTPLAAGFASAFDGLGSVEAGGVAEVDLRRAELDGTIAGARLSAWGTRMRVLGDCGCTWEFLLEHRNLHCRVHSGPPSQVAGVGGGGAAGGGGGAASGGGGERHCFTEFCTLQKALRNPGNAQLPTDESCMQVIGEEAGRQREAAAAEMRAVLEQLAEANRRLAASEQKSEALVVDLEQARAAADSTADPMAFLQDASAAAGWAESTLTTADEADVAARAEGVAAAAARRCQAMGGEACVGLQLGGSLLEGRHWAAAPFAVVGDVAAAEGVARDLATPAAVADR